MKQGRSLARRIKDWLLQGVMYLCAGITCALLIFLIGYIFFRGIPPSELAAAQYPDQLYQGYHWYPAQYSEYHLYYYCLHGHRGSPGCMRRHLPDGYATNKKIVRLISFATETLTGIPSIIFGLVGMLFFVQILGY